MLIVLHDQSVLKPESGHRCSVLCLVLILNIMCLSSGNHFGVPFLLYLFGQVVPARLCCKPLDVAEGKQEMQFPFMKAVPSEFAN